MKKLSPAKKNIIITTSLALVIFFSGAVAGLFSGSLLRPKPQRKRRMRPPAPKKIKSMMLDRISRRLELTTEQSKQVAPLVDKWSDTMESLRKANAPKYIETFNTLFDSITPLVNKQQQEKLQKMKSEAMEHHKNPMRPGPPRNQMDRPDGPPPDGDMRPPPTQLPEKNINEESN